MDILPRMLPKKQAAKYVGGMGNLAACPAKPIKLSETGYAEYDRHDLDKWIDNVKNNGKDFTRDSILGQLE